MKKILQFGPIFIIIAALLWSFDGILRISLYSLPSTIVVFYEHLLGFLILLPISIYKISELKSMSKKEWVAIIIVSIFSGALGTIFYTSALQKINYSQYSVVVLLQQQLQPIWTIATATILLKEKLSKRFLIWGVVALIAAYFITFKDLHVNFNTGSGTIMAAILAVLAGIMWGSSTAISKFVLKKVSHFTATSLRFLFAPMFAFLIIIFQKQTNYMTVLNGSQWITLLIISITTGMVAIIIYYYGLKKTPARVATICELVWPASAILIDYFLYNKSLNTTQIIGIVVLLVAINRITKETAKKII